MDAINIFDELPVEGDYILTRVSGRFGDVLYHTMMVDGHDSVASSLREWGHHGATVEWKPITFAQYRTPLFNKRAYAALWDSL